MDKAKYDQHFMLDGKLLKEIVSYADLEKTDVVLEIGFGRGYLTRNLCKKCKVIAVDVDDSFTLDLKNVEVQHGNILKMIEKLEFNKIVSNIPYSISEPLLKKMFKKEFELAVLTVGDSFYEVIADKTRRLGFLAQCFFDVEKMQDVSRKAFYPEPRTDSVVVKLTRKKRSDFEEALHKLVLQDDKKIKNGLLKLFEKKKTKKEMKKLFEEKFFDKKMYELSNEEFFSFIDVLKTKIL
ncbi:hypothetical protein C4573_01400 [Candidatus Woesearchaeota archaeon]|nr:MAG: hypothetical protein C4573_01400 [Candidatus Woesearchaeota archaeon]